LQLTYIYAEKFNGLARRGQIHA